VPSHVLLALDDPIIPARDVHELARNPNLEIIALPNGGHCGFMDGFNRESWADRKVAELLGVGRETSATRRRLPRHPSLHATCGNARQARHRRRARTSRTSPAVAT